jgi:hypothetical protein
MVAERVDWLVVEKVVLTGVMMAEKMAEKKVDEMVRK